MNAEAEAETLKRFVNGAGPGRKVIQVSSCIDPDGRYFVIAVCDDGTLWKLHGLYEGRPQWEPFPVPPKD